MPDLHQAAQAALLALPEESPQAKDLRAALTGFLPLESPAALRQSSIARYDACPLSLKFDLTVDLRQLPGTMGVLGARGVLFHRFAASAMNWMKRHNEGSIPVDVALERLLQVLAQRDVPDRDVVLVPLSQMRWMRVLVVRWALRESFDIHLVTEVERRLTHDIEVPDGFGCTYKRAITGQPDVLMAGPGPDEATIIDWKSGWAKPPKGKRAEEEREDDKLSEMGYVQQVIYGYLVMREFPFIQRVTEREVYVMAKDDYVRHATVERWEMERIEDVLAAQVAQIDAALDAGPRSERWFPVPGTHCGTCSGVRFCPVRKRFGIPATLEDAQRIARERQVGLAISKDRTPFIKGWVEEHGPIPIRHSKGRRVVGLGDSGSLKMYTPQEAAHTSYEADLENAYPEYDSVLAAELAAAGVLVDDEQEG
jgi:hypothetical protein